MRQQVILAAGSFADNIGWFVGGAVLLGLSFLLVIILVKIAEHPGVSMNKPPQLFMTQATPGEIHEICQDWFATAKVTLTKDGTRVAPHDQYSSEIIRTQIEVRNHGWTWVNWANP